MALAVVQHKSAIHGNNVPGSSNQSTLTSTPTVGNLVIAVVGVNIAESNITVNTGAGWHAFGIVYGGSGINLMAMYRYVQSGDTTTLPAYWTAGGTWWAETIWEISGVTGTWNDDFLFYYTIPAPLANGGAFPTVTVPADCLAFAATASYDGSSTPSYSGTWTTDEAQANSSNYGSISGAHRAMSSGAAIDGTPTQNTSYPYGAMMFALCDGSLPTSPYVRFMHHTDGHGVPTTLNTWNQPVAGNILITYMSWLRGATAPTFGTGWTEWTSVNGASGLPMLFGLYHYVTGGDTPTIPEITDGTGGSEYYAVSIIEIGGGFTGTWGTDHVSDKSAVVSSGTSTVNTTTDTTSAADQLALCFFANYDATTICSASGTGWAYSALVDGSNYGTWLMAECFFPTISSSVTVSLTPTESDYHGYIQSLFQGNAGGGSVSAAVTEAMSLTDSVSNVEDEVEGLTEAMGLTASASVVGVTVPPPMPIIVVVN